MSTAVTFWIPDLLHPLRIEEAGEFLSKGALPLMRQLLSRADAFPHQPKSFYDNASHLFHQPSPFPYAATMASTELDDFDGNAFWLKVDPVQMIPDRDTLVLFPGKDLAIEEAEAKALIEAFNQHFAEDRVAIEYATPQSWYLRIVQPVDIQTYPLDTVAYQPLNERFPQGNAAGYWNQLINEVQMLFFSHPVNEARRQQGLPEINSIWVWGEGCLTQQNIEQRPNAKIWSNHPYLQGLAINTQAALQGPPKNYQAWEKLNQEGDTNPSHQLILLDDIHQHLQNLSLENWLEVLEYVEKEWLSGLAGALKSKQIHSLLIDFGAGQRFHLKPAHLKRFWRLKKPFSKLVKSSFSD